MGIPPRHKTPNLAVGVSTPMIPFQPRRISPQPQSLPQFFSRYSMQHLRPITPSPTLPLPIYVTTPKLSNIYLLFIPHSVIPAILDKLGEFLIPITAHCATTDFSVPASISESIPSFYLSHRSYATAVTSQRTGNPHLSRENYMSIPATATLLSCLSPSSPHYPTSGLDLLSS